ncbi:MAG: alpha/beta fold hydrolase, partial [Chitinophagales bacterium]
MKKQLLTFIISSFSYLFIIAQPDLILSDGNYTPTSLHKQEVLDIYLTVSNVGNQYAGVSYLSIYLSSDTQINPQTDRELGKISVPALFANESTTIWASFPIALDITSGYYYIGVAVDSNDEIGEIDNGNLYYFESSIEVKTNYVYRQNIPYPILFIHGLNSEAETWDVTVDKLLEKHFWIEGGALTYNLNYDDDFSTSKISNDIGYLGSIPNLRKGDFYRVNFYVDDGVPFLDGILSNQMGVYKQGVAVRDAIKKILDVTGREKIILVGHSMGGLAARQYLQNTSIWQNDGKHHIAKLLTIATPHGGSNSSLFNFEEFLIDTESEAVRDLRTTYSTSGEKGVFLFGGFESDEVMDDFFWGFNDFKNVDVNCNGIEGDYIEGLNEKLLPTDLQYTCIIGASNGGDGVVDVSSANLNNYRSEAAAELFHYSGPHPDLLFLHNGIHKVPSLVSNGMDVPYVFDYAYQLPFDKMLYETVTKQSDNYVYGFDYDDYKFSLLSNGTVKLDIVNIPVSNFTAYIVDNNYNYLYELNSEGDSQILVDIDLEKGDYFLEIEALVEDENNVWQYPYGI